MRFHHYLYGREFICQSDHKPLDNIHLKHLSDAQPRLQRLLLQVQSYNFVITYVPGKDILMADTINRVIPNEKTETKGLHITTHELTPQLSRIQVESIQKATQQDKTVQLLIQQVLEGWPESCRKLPEILRPFGQWRDDLSTEHSCITWKGRFFISITLRGHCLKPLHNGHPGVTKMTLRAKGSMFWPNINKIIAKHVHSCVPCQTISNSQQNEPTSPIDVPSRPWKVLGIDIFVQGNKYYLLTADYYSKFPYVQKYLAFLLKK